MLERAVRDVSGCQRALLARILSLQRGCEWGRRYGFAQIHDPDGYRATLPVMDLAELAEAVGRMAAGEADVLVTEPVVMFGETGGTTGPSKLIPVTRSQMECIGFHFRVWRDVLASHFPDVAPTNALSVINYTAPRRTAAGIPVGSLAQLRAREGGVSNGWFPREVFNVGDLTSRYYGILRVALEAPLRAMIAINPTTLIILAQRLQQHAPELLSDLAAGALAGWVQCSRKLRTELETRLCARPALARRLQAVLDADGELRPERVWPSLDVLACWTHGHVGTFARRLHRFYGARPVLELGHLATEGAFSLPTSHLERTCVLDPLTAFYEFVPRDAPAEQHPLTLLAHELKAGREYRMIITGFNGLYRYDMQDVVRVTGWHEQAPRMEFVEKSGNMLSITGEKLGEAHVAAAFAEVSRRLARELRGSVCVQMGELPRYLVAVEGLRVPELTGFVTLYDAVLRDCNSEYGFHRGRGALLAPSGLRLAPGTYQRWFEVRARRVADSQIKHPWLFRDESSMRAELGCPQ